MRTSRRVLRYATSAFGCVLAAAIIVVAVPTPQAAAPVTVNYAGDLARLVRIAPYPAVAPAGLPASWQPVGSRLTVGDGEGPGTVTWQLDFTTPTGTLASIAETDAVPTAFIRRMTNNGTALPPVQLAGQIWQASSTPSRGQQSMYYTARGMTVVVTGNATQADLRVLAAALRPAKPQPSR